MLLSCLFFSFSLLGEPAALTPCPGSHVYIDSLAEQISYYKNGQIRSRERMHYNSRGELYKSMQEKFWKNGKRKYRAHFIDGTMISYEARYNKEGQLTVERSFVYDSEGFLVRVDTRVGSDYYEKNYEKDPLPPLVSDN